MLNKITKSIKFGKNFLFPNIHKYKFSSVDQSLQKEPEFLEMVQIYFEQASKVIDIPHYYINVIKHAKAVIRFNFPLIRDDGSIQVITAFRSQHSLHYLPTKGGTRYADHIGKIKLIKTFPKQKHSLHL
jgi:hypothetical protein